MFSFDFAEAFVCFVGFLSGESAVSVAALIEGRAVDEAATPVRGEDLLYLTIIIEMIWIDLMFSRLKIED